MSKEAYSGERLTRAQAIRKKCLDCCGGQSAEVRECPVHACALWPFRLGSESRSMAHKTERHMGPK